MKKFVRQFLIFCALCIVTGCNRPIDDRITVQKEEIENFPVFLKRVSDTLPPEEKAPWNKSANEVAKVVLASNLNIGKEDDIERVRLIFSESTPREIIRIGAILRLQRLSQGIDKIKARTKQSGPLFLTEDQAQMFIDRTISEANLALKDFQESAKN